MFLFTVFIISVLVLIALSIILILIDIGINKIRDSAQPPFKCAGVVPVKIYYPQEKTPQEIKPKEIEKKEEILKVKKSKEVKPEPTQPPKQTEIQTIIKEVEKTKPVAPPKQPVVQTTIKKVEKGLDLPKALPANEFRRSRRPVHIKDINFSKFNNPASLRKPISKHDEEVYRQAEKLRIQEMEERCIEKNRRYFEQKKSEQRQK